MQIRDSLVFDGSGLKMSKDGYLVGDAKVSRAGNVQEYLGAEIGLTGDSAGQVFGVYRDPDTVFDETAMLSLAGKPVTRGHPPGGVDASNIKDHWRGNVGGTIVRDGEHVVASMVIMDAAAVKEVQDGARSLSAGYMVDVTPDEGTAPDGTPYQFRQSGNLRFNHVAYLPDNNPRAGNTRIGDSGPSRNAWGGSIPNLADQKEPNMGTQTVVVGDTAIDVLDAHAPKLEAFKVDMAKKISDMEASHADEIAKKDEALGEVKAKLADAEKQIPDAKALAKLVSDRASLVGDALRLAPDVKIEGLTDAEIRKAVVAAREGAEAVADASDAEILGVFKHLAKHVKADAQDHQKDPAAKAIADSTKSGATDGWDKVLADMKGA